MPNDYDLYDSLGEAYFDHKDLNNSIVHYAKSLTLNSENENAIKKLVLCTEARNELNVKN